MLCFAYNCRFRHCVQIFDLVLDPLWILSLCCVVVFCVGGDLLPYVTFLIWLQQLLRENICYYSKVLYFIEL